jgi:mRNA-degrading endonuclease RelE of RelBE toxin-antitoxin system
MSYSVNITPVFKKHLKALQKKFPSIKNDFIVLIKSLTLNPLQGNALGKDCFKIRWKITSKNTGKNGAARIITYVKVENKTVTLLDVFDKSEKESITDKEIEALMKKLE